jgi:hypothetical protein
MKHARFVCLSLCLTTTFLSSQNPVPPISPSTKVAPPIRTTKTDPQAQARILDQYGKLPLSFEANNGQTDARVKFLSRTGGYTLFLTGDEAMLALSGKKVGTGGAKIGDAAHKLASTIATTKAGSVLRMKLRNANRAAKVMGMDELAGTSNYFIGNDPAKWRTGVPTYAKVKYEGIYSGIDLVYYGNQRQLEYDFIVAPHANPHRIAFDVRGAKGIRRNMGGDLVLKMGEGEIRWHKPLVYQEKNGKRQEIGGRYVIASANRVGFEVAKYDATSPLYIDPLVYSTYLGGGLNDQSYGIAVDSNGNAYVTGGTDSTNFPTTGGTFQTTLNGALNAFVAKINFTGSALVYSTYLGGGNQDFGNGIAVDSAGDAYLTGWTSSTNFPVTPGAFQTTCGNCASYGDAFVTELNPTASGLVYSTYLDGSTGSSGAGIAIDGAGDAYVTGTTESTDFPVTPMAFQKVCGSCYYQNRNYYGNAFVTEFDATGSALVYSTYLGGSTWENGSGIAVDNTGSAYVIGTTESTDFPITQGAYQTTLHGFGNSFVTEFDPTGSALVYSTYLGGSTFENGSGIAVDNTGSAYVTGTTESTDFPVTPGAFQAACGKPYQCEAAFVAKLNPSGSELVYSTYLGGNWNDFGYAVAVDGGGNAYVTGQNYSRNFPVTPGAFQTACKNSKSHCEAYGNAFVTKFNPTGTALLYSTYLGGSGVDHGSGIAVDGAGNAFVAGWTDSTNFPTKIPLQSAKGGDFDAFVTKIPMLATTTTSLSSSPNPSTYGQAVTFTANVISYAGARPDGEIVSFMKGKTLLGTGMLTSGSATFATSTLKVGTPTVTAVYAGDSNFAGSKSKAVKQVVEE